MVRIRIELGGNGHRHPGTILVIVPIFVLVIVAAVYCTRPVALSTLFLVHYFTECYEPVAYLVLIHDRRGCTLFTLSSVGTIVRVYFTLGRS